MSLAGFRDVGQQVIDKVNSDEWKAHERESTPTLVEDHDPEYDSKSDASLCDVPSEDESVPEQLSWADFKPFIPAYVKDVSFTVDSETMRTQDHEALRTFFPGVHIQHSKHEESKEIQTELVTQEHIPEYFYPITTHSIVPVEKEDACLQSQGTQTDLPNERQYKSQGIQALVVKVKYNPHFPDAEPVPAVLNQVTYDEGTQTQNQNVWNKGTQTHFVKFKYTTESQGTQNARSTKCVASSQIRCTQTRPILVFDFPPDPENTESGTTPDASVLQAEALIAPEEGVIHKDELPQLPLEDLARIETELSRADTIAEQILVHTPFFPTINRPTSHEAVASTVEASGGIERAVGTIEAYCKWAGKQTRQLGLTSGEGETSASVPGRPSTSHHPTPVKRKDSAGSTHSFVPPPSRYSSPSHESNDDTSVYTDILIRTIAGKHNIEFSNPKHLKEAYADWKTNQIVKCYGPRKYKLDPYYLNLVDLYIVGHHTKDKALMLEAFLTFQKTNFKWGGDVPTLDAALKAFQHLPHGSGLCKWITKFFSYEWETKKTAKTYTGLVEKFPTCSSEAIGAFLFEVAKTRSAHIKGGEVAVLKAWCKFHDHRNDDERRACEQVREEILGSKRDPTSLEELVKEQDEEMLEEAEKVIVEHGGRAIYAGTRPAKKRKASPEPETPRKRSRPRKSMGSG